MSGATLPSGPYERCHATEWPAAHDGATAQPRWRSPHAACATLVTPTKWKPAVGIHTGADKEASRQRALQLFPDQAVNLARKKDHARADAMLLAYFGLKLSALAENARRTC